MVITGNNVTEARGRFNQKVMDSKKIILGILPSLGGSIESQRNDRREGLFLDYYVAKYAERFDVIYYFSYGDQTTELQRSATKQFTIFPNRRRWHRYVYQFLLPFLNCETIRKCSVIRVMQANGIIPAILAKWRFKIPFIVTYGYDYAAFAKIEGHWLKTLMLRCLLPFFLRDADGIIVTTEESKRWIEKHVGISDKIQLVPNGVDVAWFSQVHERNASRSFQLLFVGRLERQKNLFFLMDMIAILCQKTEVEVTLIGDGSLRNDLEIYAKERNLPVKFLGSIPYADIKNYHAKANCFLMPSLTEGHPKALIEAMSSGLACVVSNCSGNNALVKHNQTGLLLELGSAEMWADAVFDLLKNPKKRQALGLSARNQIVEEFDIHKTLAQEIDLLEKAAMQKQKIQ